MLFADGAFALVMLGLWIFCIIDVITTPEGATRNLPKMVWLLIVILLSDIGSLAWLVAGREWNRTSNLPYKGNYGSAPRARRAPERFNGTNPDDDEAFLAGLRVRAEEQRRRAREASPGDTPDDPNAGGTGR